MGCGDRSRDSDPPLVRFVLDGVAAQHKVVVLLHSTTAADVRRLMARHGRGDDYDGWLASGQLSVLSSEEAYRDASAFDAEATIQWGREQTARGFQEGYRAARFLAEMSWADGLLDPEFMLDYERRVDHLFQELPLIGVCQYKPGSLTPQALADMRDLHPLQALVPRLPGEDLVSSDPAQARQWERVFTELSDLFPGDEGLGQQWALEDHREYWRDRAN